MQNEPTGRNDLNSKIHHHHEMVRCERAKLAQRIEKLIYFLLGQAKSFCDDEEIAIMIRQRETMQVYLSILDEQIKRF